MRIADRKRRLTRVVHVVLALGLWLNGLHPARSADPGWKAGVARINITPDQPLWMAGYASRTQPADGKYSDLWAKALLLEDPQGRRGCLICLDLIGIDRTLSRAVCTRLEHEFGLTRAQVVLSFSHTHTGPVVGRNLEPLHYRLLDAAQQARIDQYGAALPERLCAVVANAQQTLAPCRLRWGSGTATFAVNRRNNRESDVPELRRQDKLQGPVDHDVPVLAVYRPDNQPLAVVFGYACHATVLSDNSWSGDYPGFAQLELERRVPGCTALFWAGCGADQNPLPRRELRLAQDYGRQLAESVECVLAQPMTPVQGALRTTYREIALPLDTLPTTAQLRQQADSGNVYERARAAMLLEQLDRTKTLATDYPYPIGVWTIGDQVQLVFLGGEVVVDFALRLKRELRGTRTWVAGYCNDVMAYIPSERVLQEGGYEGATAMVYYGLPTRWAPGVEAAIVTAVEQWVGDERERRP